MRDFMRLSRETIYPGADLRGRGTGREAAT